MFQTGFFSVHHQELKTARTASGICQTNTWHCMCSFELLMMDGKNPSETCRASYRNKYTVKHCILLVVLCEYYFRYIRSCFPLTGGRLRHPQSEDAACRSDRDPFLSREECGIVCITENGKLERKNFYTTEEILLHEILISQRNKT